MGGFDGREKEGLVILDICWGMPISMNSVLEGFSKSRFQDIQDDVSEIAS